MILKTSLKVQRCLTVKQNIPDTLSWSKTNFSDYLVLCRTLFGCRDFDYATQSTLVYNGRKYALRIETFEGNQRYVFSKFTKDISNDQNVKNLNENLQKKALTKGLSPSQELEVGQKYLTNGNFNKKSSQMFALIP